MNEQLSKKPITDLFHDCGYIYISTIEPAVGEEVTLRLRTEKGNVTRAFVELSYDGDNWQSYEMKPEKEDETGHFLYFIATLPGQEKMFKYRFRAENDCPENSVYYERTFVGANPLPRNTTDSTAADNYWTLIPGFHTPDWAKGVTWYSIMPDAYYNGDITNDEPSSGSNQSVSWNLSQHTLAHKLGGDLRGVEKKLDHIKSIGADAVFMDPIHKTSQNAGYGPEFFNQIENSFGNKRALVELARSVHDRGLHYMIDVVFAFVASRDIWYNSGNTNIFPAAAQDWNSKYHDFFLYTGEEGDTHSIVGSWGGAALNHASKLLGDKLFRQKDSYLQYYCSAPFDVDAIRFDCGGALYGIREDGSRLSADEILAEMRPYLRGINPEMLLLSEYSGCHSVETGVWDSRWNLEFVNYSIPYLRGEKPESFMFERYEAEIHNVPRNFGLCQYNSINDHDRERCKNVNPYAFKALQLIHMTEVGSPCIYYGDEIKLERNDTSAMSSFYCMDWNEANWNYTVLHNLKALTELRHKYSAVRTGIIKYMSVDDYNNILAFARKDENGTVITVARRRESTFNMSLDVRDLSEVDGTVFTDWFTGKQYVAENGFIDVEIPAGGTIFVKGTESASHKGGFSIDGIGCDAAAVTVPREAAFESTAKGAIGETDELTFVNNDVFNTFILSAACKKGGKGAVLVRASKEPDAAFIGATVNGNKLSVYARVSDGAKLKRIATAEVDEGSTVVITRDSTNAFTVTASRAPEKLWNVRIKNFMMRMPNTVNRLVEGFHVNIPNHAYAGVASLDGARFENVRVEYEKKTILSDSFKNGDSAMFDFAGVDRSYSKAGITLCPAAEGTELLTNSPDEDWTFKTQLKFNGLTEGDCAGVISRQDEDIAVFAGRMVIDGKQQLVFGRETAGKLAVLYTAPDTLPNNKVAVQLQRIGTSYTAVYSYNGKNYRAIGKEITANLSLERVGLAVNGNTSATYSYACFGNSIEDSTSFNTPLTPGSIEIKLDGYFDVKPNPVYRIVSGDWDYANEGYIQRSRERAQLGITDKQFTGFKVDGTYLIDEGKGFVGFEFSKESHDTPLGDGVLVSLNDEGRLSVSKGAEVYASVALNAPVGTEIKIAVEYKNGNLAAFVGNDGEPVIVLNGYEAERGYIAYFTEGVVAHVNNYLVASYDSPIAYIGDFSMRNGKYFRNDWEFRPIFFCPTAIACTNFVTSLRLTPEHFSETAGASVGVNLCAPEGRYLDHGCSFALNKNGELVVKVNGSRVAAASVRSSKKYTDIMIVKQGNTFSVYVNGSKEKLLEYVDAEGRLSGNGGAFVYFADRATTLYSGLKINDTGISGDPETSRIYKSWMK